MQQRDRLRLVRADDDKSARFSRYFGYSPLSVALIEQIITAARAMPLQSSKPFKQAMPPPLPLPAKNRVVVVYFLGGVTSAELAALRELSTSLSVQIVVAATDLISSHALLCGVVESFKLHFDCGFVKQ